ncbi:MAG: hypothetical protein EP330_07680 [Deltaproteobacteria bacterium]|nr:MAG: hypothetical protein EP330_07680 [Deltaproteobacteria bacterium]
MSQLVSTLRSLLDEADGHLRARRPQKARSAYERLLEQAQERADRPMVVMARAMLARVAVQRRALDEAQAMLDEAASWLDPGHHESRGRMYAARVRWIAASGEPALHDTLREYLDWADRAEQWEEAVDASALLAEHAADTQDSVQWLERAIDIARLHGVSRRLGGLYTHLASLHERDGNGREALRAHQAARSAHLDHGDRQDQVRSTWAVGASAVSVEDWPLAQQRLEEALSLAEGEADVQGLVPVVLADLATVYAASGDVIEARRAMQKALDLAREQDLASWWPERWAAMTRQSDALDAAM